MPNIIDLTMAVDDRHFDTVQSQHGHELIRITRDKNRRDADR